MTELTPNRVVAQLADLSRELDALVSKLDAAEIVAINAREDFTVAYAKVFLSSEGAMEVRKHKTVIETSVARIAAELADQHCKAIRRQLDSTGKRIEIGRTLAATLRTEMHNFGAGAA